MEGPLSPLERDHSLSVVLPGGLEKNATVHGSKPVMDLLVTLCASYHLNPSDYTVEFLSPNKNNISFKPNSPVGSLEAEKIVLKPKAVEEKIRRPYMPEASVRLLINYNKSHKAVVRVSPRVPLETLLPVVCEKCEMKEETTVLLRDSRSRQALDLSKTLNDHGLREMYAKDTAGVQPVDHQHHPNTQETAATPSDATPPPPLQDTPKKEKKPKKSAGFLGFFRRTKKKSSEEAWSAPPSPGLEKQVGLNGRDVSPSAAPPADGPKKRRAPPPPMGSSQSVPNNIGACHLRGTQRSEESPLRSTKRRAPPPPPCANTLQELQADTEVKGAVDSLTAVQEGRESDGSDSVNLSLSPSSSPPPSSSSSRRSPAPLCKTAHPYLPSLRGKDFSDARCALAKVLTSSVSKGALVKRLRNSDTFPKFSSSPSFTLVTQRRSGDVCAEPEPLSKPSLPTEPEWEDPVQRKGTTTFKVVPSNKNPDPEASLEVPDQIIVGRNPEGEGSPELGENKSESEEDPCSESSDSAASLQPPLDLNTPVLPGSPLSEVGDAIRKGDASEAMPAAQSDCSEGEPPCEGGANSEGPAELSQSPSRRPVSADVDQYGSRIDEGPSEEGAAQAEEEEEEEEGGEDGDAFPPPPSPVFFNEVPEKTDEGGAASCEPTSERSAPKLQGIIRAAPSRFAQAVALAVQRSRLQNHGKGSGPEAPGGPQSTLPSPPRSMYQFGA